MLRYIIIFLFLLHYSPVFPFSFSIIMNDLWKPATVTDFEFANRSWRTEPKSLSIRQFLFIALTSWQVGRAEGRANSTSFLFFYCAIVIECALTSDTRISIALALICIDDLLIDLLRNNSKMIPVTQMKWFQDNLFVFQEWEEYVSGSYMIIHFKELKYTFVIGEPLFGE